MEKPRQPCIKFCESVPFNNVRSATAYSQARDRPRQPILSQILDPGFRSLWLSCPDTGIGWSLAKKTPRQAAPSGVGVELVQGELPRRQLVPALPLRTCRV